MKNLLNTTRIGRIALIIGIFSSSLLFANGTSGEEVTKEKSNDEIAIEKLIPSIMVDKDLLEMEAMLTAEGVISCKNEVIVRIINAADELVYEGTYNGFISEDKTLKKYMEKADLLLNVGNVTYYMLF